MKPAWDKLMKNWNKGDRLKNTVIADVDCTTDAGKPLCEKVGVSGYPTIKWGDTSDLQDYSGGREYDDIKAFAKENIKPACSPANIDLCDEDKKKQIADIQAMSLEELSAKVDEKKAEIKKEEEHFDAEVKKLQETYSQLEKEKKEKIDAINAAGLGLMQSVQAHAKKTEAAATEKKEEL